MDFVTPIITMVSLLWDPIARRVRYITKLQDNVGLLRTAKEDLIDTRSEVERNIAVSERRGLTPANKVRRWVQRVEATEVEVNQIENDSNQRTRCLRDCHPNCWSSYKLGKKVVRKLAYVSELKSQGVFSHVAEESLLPDPVTEMPSTSTAVGMESTMQKVLRHLEEDEVGVIGVYGMGGVGKTTLLKEINNGFLQRSHDFDVVIWVVVSKEPNVKNIQKVIGDKLGLTLPQDQDEAAQRRFNVLRRKRFALFLDDVWSRLDLEKVGIPHPNIQNKCKLIFSTRSEAVCGHMKARKTIKVECLAWKEAWDLFLDNVGEEIMNSHPDIPTLAENVVKKCDGLPLALITIGRAMVSKKTPQEWKHAIAVLGKSASDFPGMDDEVLPLLKFSYDSLRGDTVKLCFLYCSLYPEDYSISKNELIEKWIGEGFLDECNDVYEARNKRHDLIGILKVACLLEDGEEEETEVRMHDIIRELALWIASGCGERNDNCIVQAGTGSTDAPILKKWKEAIRISLMKNAIEVLNETPSCPNLITLMLQSNRKLSIISSNFFQFMPCLRVLDLSHTNLNELPTGMGELVELQYFNLEGTPIVALPQDLGTLAKLKYLNLRNTRNLERIPHKVIAGLSRLQVLELWRSNYNRYWKVEDSSNDNESGVDLVAELEGLKQLNDLSIDFHKAHGINRFLSSQIFTKSTRSLVIRDCNALTCFQLSSTFRNMRRLHRLIIHECYELEELIIDAEEVDGANQLLPTLEHLELWNLPKLKTILVPPGCLQNLRASLTSNGHASDKFEH